jgi:CheY-like chemotaxis protein
LGSTISAAKYPLPAIVLLDLNTPRVNGFEVLAWLRSREQFKHITVHILSASMRQD